MYAKAERKASVMPMMLSLFGVNPILWASFASFMRVFWIFFFSFVSMSGFLRIVFLNEQGV